MAKRVDVWSPSQFRMGYEYLLRQAPPAGKTGKTGRSRSPRPNAPDIGPMNF